MMASRRRKAVAPVRSRLKQSSLLLEGLSKYDGKEQQSNNENEDYDPYKFEDSQSLEVKEPLIWGSATNARVRIPKLSTRAGVNRTASAVRTPASAVRTPSSAVRTPSSAVSGKKTPLRAAGKPSSRASVSKRVTAGVQSTKTPKQKQKKVVPASQAEVTEVLRPREEEDLVRQQEAKKRMKQDAERRDRKRKREESRREFGEDEPTSKFGNMQRNIELAIEKVDTAKNLSESKLRAMLAASAKPGESELEDPLLNPGGVVAVPQGMVSDDILPCDNGGMVCDDPPLSLTSGGWNAPSPPLNSPPREGAELAAGSDGSQEDLPISPPLNRLSSPQLKAVSVKKLSMRKLHLSKAKYSRVSAESVNLTHPRPNEVQVIAEVCSVQDLGKSAACDDVKIDLTSPTPSTSPNLVTRPVFAHRTSSHDAPVDLQDCASTPAQKAVESPSRCQQPPDVSNDGVRIHATPAGCTNMVPDRDNTPEMVPDCDNTPEMVPDCANTHKMMIPSRADAPNKAVPDDCNTPEMDTKMATRKGSCTTPSSRHSHPPNTDSTTPSLNKGSQTTGKKKALGLSRTMGAPSSVSIAADSETPPLARTHPVARVRNNGRLPASDCTKVGGKEEVTKSTRRNLSLSYSRKRGPQSNQALPPSAQRRRLSICDETVEIGPTAPCEGPNMSDASAGKARRARTASRPSLSLNKDRSTGSEQARNTDSPPVKTSNAATAAAASLVSLPKDTGAGDVTVGGIPASHSPPDKVAANISRSPLAASLPGNQAKDNVSGSTATAVSKAAHMTVKDSVGMGSNPSGKPGNLLTASSGKLPGPNGRLPLSASPPNQKGRASSKDHVSSTAAGSPSKKLTPALPPNQRGGASSKDHVSSTAAGSPSKKLTPVPPPNQRGGASGKDHVISTAAGSPSKKQTPAPPPNQRGGASSKDHVISTAAGKKQTTALPPNQRGGASGKDHVISTAAGKKQTTALPPNQRGGASSKDHVISTAAGSPSKKQTPAPPPNQRGVANNVISTTASPRPSKKRTLPTEGPRVLRKPPQLYAHGAWSPANYTKVILGSFNSYFSQLAKAQSGELSRVHWGQPIKSVGGRRWGGAASSFVFLGSRRTRSCHPVDEYADLYLKIVPPPELEKTMGAAVSGKKPDSFDTTNFGMQGRHATEQNGHVTERDGHVTEREGHVPEREGHVTEREGHVTERDGHVTERDGHVTERDGHVTERDGHVTEWEGHVTERDGHVTEREGHVTERDGHVTERDGHVTEQCSHVMEWDTPGGEADSQVCSPHPSMDHQAIHDENVQPSSLKCHISQSVGRGSQMDEDPASLVVSSQQQFLDEVRSKVQQAFLGKRAGEQDPILTTSTDPEIERRGSISETDAAPETILISATQDEDNASASSHCHPILISTQGGPMQSGENTDSNGSPARDPVLVCTQDGRDYDYGYEDSYSNSSPRDPILIGTQDEPGSDHSRSNRARESYLRPVDPATGALDALYGRHSTPSPTSSVGGQSAPKAASPWLNSRKPPPSARKVRKKTPSRTKQLSLPKTASSKAKKPSKGGQRGRGKGTAAGRFLRSNAASMSGDDGDSSDGVVGGASPGSRERVGSDESSDEEEDRRDTFISPVVRAMRSGGVTSILRRPSISRSPASRGGARSREGSMSRGGYLTPSSSRHFSTPMGPSTSRGLSTSRVPSASSGPYTSEVQRSDVIDLTEELHRTTTDPTPRVDPTPSGAAAADPKRRCPICQKMFAESEIELHASECQGSLSEEGGAGSDDEIPRRRVRLARKAREAEPRGGPDTSRRSHQLTLGTFGSTSSTRVIRSAGALSPDADADTHDPSPSSPVDNDSVGSDTSCTSGFIAPDQTELPQDIRCEDGGYEVVTDTVSSSPLRTFTRIGDLDPQQRASFQNQFQHKGGRGKGRASSRGKQTTLGIRTGANWTGRDGFDELIGASSGFRGHGYRSATGGVKKKRPHRYYKRRGKK